MSDRLPTQLKVLQSIGEVSSAAWDALLTPQSTPFLDWAWLEALESTGAATPEAGWHPRHLTLWRGNRLIAAAPAYLKDDSYGEFVYDFAWASAAERIGFAYYPKLILAVPFSPATGERLLVAPSEDRAARQEELGRGALELARAEGLSGVHVLFPTADEAALLSKIGFGIRHGVQYHWQNQGYRTYDDFLAQLTSKRRNQLKRERRAPAAQGITLSTRGGQALASVDPAEVFRIYCSTVDKYPWGHRHLTEAFFARVLKALPHRVELVEARRGDELVAGALNLASEEVLYGRYWGCFEEHPFLHFNVCLYHPVEQAILRKLRRFEPGAGGEHKLVRGFLPAVTYSAHWLFQPALDRAVRDFLATERKAIASGLPQWGREAGFKGGKSSVAEPHDPDSNVVTETRTRSKLQKPKLFRVLLHNDNYTTRDFVVAVLREVFHRTEAEAVQIMLHVHHNGLGLAGVYTFDVATTKVRTVEALAREQGFPLRLSMEPEDD